MGKHRRGDRVRGNHDGNGTPRYYGLYDRRWSPFRQNGQRRILLETQ